MRMTPFRSIAAPLAAALALMVPAAGHDTLRAQAPPAGLVQVDFRALDADGKPVTDLKPSDVTLKVGGKAREIRSLKMIAGDAAAAPSAPANPPYGSNTEAAGAPRTVMLVVDDESVAPGREKSLTAALTRLVGGVPAADRIGLLSVRRGGVNIPPSTNRAPVLAAIQALRGQSATETSDAFTCRTQVTLQALESILGSAPAAAPTTVVFMSASLSQPGESMARMRSTASSPASELCRLTTENFEKVGSAAAGSRAQFYVVQVVDGTPLSTSEAGPGIENVAGVTGVETLRLTSSVDTVVDKIVREMAASYTASFAPEPGDRTAAPVPMELKVTRPGVTTLAAAKVAMPRMGAKASARMSARDMIGVGTVFTDLPLRAAGYASRNNDDKLKIIALFEPIEPGTKLTSAVVGLFGQDDKLKAQWSAQPDDFARAPVTAALTVAPGIYRMRVAATDSAGRAGTADYTLNAALTQAGPLQLSALVVGSPKAGSFAPQLHFGPKDPAGAGYLEIYGVPKGAAVTVNLEIAPSEDAPALGTVPAQVVPGDSEDMRRAVGGFSIENLPAGDHVMRAIVSVDGKPVGRAVRTMRKGM